MAKKCVIDLRSIEAHLSRFNGGRVFISKDYWDEGIAIIKLDNRPIRNAISGKMMVDFRDCVSELEQWKEGKAAILMGEGKNFCSGGDLNFVKATSTNEEGYNMSHWMHTILKRFLALPLVKVSLVHGPALGGGSEIVVYSDYILVAENAKIGFVHGKMGITPAWGGATRLVSVMGEKKARTLLLSGKIYDARECVEIGLADEIVRVDTMLEEALNFMKKFTCYHHTITQSIQKIIHKSTTCNSDDSLEYEKEVLGSKWGSTLNLQALNLKINHLSNVKQKLNKQ